eukprot:2640133-Pleurochrysis_carterae.AAC.1
MCAVSTPDLEKVSRVSNSSNDSLCAVCAGLLTIDQVLMTSSDQAAAKFAAKESSETQADASFSEATNVEDGSCAATKVPGIEATPAADCAMQTAAASDAAQNVPALDQGCQPTDNVSMPTFGVASDATSVAATNTAAPDTVAVPKSDAGHHAEETSDKTADTADEAVVPEPAGADESSNRGVDDASATELGDGANDEAGSNTEAGQAEAKPVLVGTRVREVTGSYDEPRHGLVFSENASQFAVAFDDLSWRTYKRDDFLKEFTVVMDDSDVSGLAVHSVLLGRKGALNLASGFLFSSSAAASKATPLGWECFETYKPAPFNTCPARFADPPLDLSIEFGSPVSVQPPFVSLDGGKVGMDPSATFTARVMGVLLGGTWNRTNQHIDKRRWVLVECAEHFYLAPLERVSAGTHAKLSPTSLTESQCKEYMQKLVLDRSP